MIVSMSEAIHPGTPTTTSDRWWVTAIIAAGLTAIVVTMVRLWPMALWTWVIGSAIAVFAVVMYFNPRHWLKRRSGACLGIAGAGAALPAVAGALSVPQGWIQFSTDASPWIVGIFGLLSLGFAWLDRTPNVKQLEEPILDIKQGVSEIQVEQLSQTEILQKMAAEMQGLRGASEDEIEKKLRPLIEQELKDQYEQQLADKERVIKSLIDGFVTASRKGDSLEQVKKSGDGRTIVAALREISVSDEESLIQRHREIAEWAYLVGEIDQAERSIQMILRLRPNDIDAISRLGHIQRLRGRLDEAEGSYRRVLALAADDEAARAVAYSNLSIVMRIRGELDGAEAMLLEALKIDEEDGNLEGMASTYGNLGNVMLVRRDLDGAEAMYRKSLEIDEKRGRLEGMASSYGNLGLVMKRRGDLDGAEVMHRKSLEMEEKLGRLEGIASTYGNLGQLRKIRGDLDGARELWTKARDHFDKLGAQQDVDKIQRLIDKLPK